MDAFGCIATALGRVAAVAAFFLAALPAGANNTVGAWSTVRSWPLIAVHAVLMPDGRVLTYGTSATGQQTAIFIYDVWDPSAGLDAGHTTLPNMTAVDIFCSSQVVLPSGGQVFIAGGDNWTGASTTNTGNSDSTVFAYGSNTLTKTSGMNRARWYSSSITLLNGETYIQGGAGGTDRPEIRGTNGAFRLMTGANTSSFDFMYPRNFIAPDGRVFGYDSAGRMYYVNTSGAGAVTTAGQFTGPTGSDSSAAMFRPGRILQFGGNSRNALVIDITGGAPAVSQTQQVSTQRRLVTATILADGRVLATGGSLAWNEMTGVNNSAEIWNPTTGQWQVGPSGARARLYHSTSVLLPDASVLVAGGGAPGPQVNTNIEVYYPSYLYSAGGGFAVRPLIEDAPGTIDIGETFDVEMGGGGAVSRVVMVKTSSVTHSWNMEQRYVELTFQQDGSRLRVQAPTRAADAPPGFYMLFAFNAAGTPAVAPILRVGVAANPNPAITPSLVHPGDQAGDAGAATSLPLTATDPNGDTLTYSASGLPSGLSVHPTTGVISGTPGAAGTFNVVVTASDGVNSDSESFVWVINQGPPYVLNTPPPPSPAVTGGLVTYEASVTGGVGLQFRWDFDDGTPVTPFSSSPSFTHVFTEPGIHYVTLTARDASGREQQTVIVQMVHHPLTANRPAMSSNIVFEDRPTGADRLWVVNQDNDSVSAFNTATGTRLKHVKVGTAPRSVAIAPNGRVWVTNKLSASITVLDAATREVLRTIALPAGSQPYGIAAAPTGSAMYVALEATGRLLKIDAVTEATLASLAVGPNPRHVAVSADGSRVYVSRFITPPLPGESTASVQTQSGGQPAGGEVVVVNGPAMTIERTIVLRHSDLPDFENQGRGIPNYLGATAISPDGRSAWVPSKQDNVKRGVGRDGLPLNFQNTVRAVSSRLDLQAGSEDHPGRIDHDNAGLASAAHFDARGIYLFVALETSRQVAVIDAYDGQEIFRFAVGRAPQGLALSSDGRRLYVNNFMDRRIGVYDLSTLLTEGIADVPQLGNWIAAPSEKLTPQVLVGKQLFYDAGDTRLARDAYISCASCHNDGGHDGRTWDLTGFGEGLRNTSSLRGRAGAHGSLHWSNNFDEVQDFEGQIRNLAGGTGLMTNAEFNAGTRSQPLGDAKAGVSADLDALAAYVASLNAFAPSPLRNSDGTLTPAATTGKSVYQAKGCGSCHGGSGFTASAVNNPVNIGTIDADSGNRLGGPLSGIDIPTLRDVWATAPYLHRGSAATLGDAIRAHAGVTVTDAELPNLVAYVSQIGSQEGSATATTPNTGTGLGGAYFNNMTLGGTPALERVENVAFTWSSSPGPNVNANQFSVRWTGFVESTSSGSHQFQTKSNDGVRLWIDGELVIDNWTAHATTTNTSATIALVKNQRYAVTMEYYDNAGNGVARLLWKRPATANFVAVPVTRLYAN
ncbi:MAG TPA: PA14 domain-containing protein [Steroidobacteraceae bacterium]|nr:PA14 domain-containing protein [Steroidobacteraceae bacterium]